MFLVVNKADVKHKRFYLKEEDTMISPKGCERFYISVHVNMDEMSLPSISLVFKWSGIGGKSGSRREIPIVIPTGSLTSFEKRFNGPVIRNLEKDIEKIVYPRIVEVALDSGLTKKSPLMDRFRDMTLLRKATSQAIAYILTMCNRYDLKVLEKHFMMSECITIPNGDKVVPRWIGVDIRLDYDSNYVNEIELDLDDLIAVL